MKMIKRSVLIFTQQAARSLLAAGTLFFIPSLQAVIKPEPRMQYPSTRSQIRELEKIKVGLLAAINNSQEERKEYLASNSMLEQEIARSEQVATETEQALQKPMTEERHMQWEKLMVSARAQNLQTQRVIEGNLATIQKITQNIEAMEQAVRRIDDQISRLMWRRL